MGVGLRCFFNVSMQSGWGSNGLRNKVGIVVKESNEEVKFCIQRKVGGGYIVVSV